MFKSDYASGEAPDTSIAVRPRHNDAISGWAEGDRGLGLDLSETTPTLLPDLLYAVSKEAGRLASDPFNALDNNPFIMRELLIVSQALHAAAATIEKRFEALFSRPLVELVNRGSEPHAADHLAF